MTDNKNEELRKQAERICVYVDGDAPLKEKIYQALVEVRTQALKEGEERGIRKIVEIIDFEAKAAMMEEGKASTKLICQIRDHLLSLLQPESTKGEGG